SAPFGGNTQPSIKEVKANSSSQTGRSSHSTNPGVAKQPKVHTGSYANVASGAQGPLISPSPALVLEDSCLVERDMSIHVMGKVKDFSSIPNLYTILTDEGFSGAKLTYMGGTWVMIELDKVDTKEHLMNHSGIKSWFLEIKDAVDEFVSEDRIIWMDIEGFLLRLGLGRLLSRLARSGEKLLTWKTILLCRLVANAFALRLNTPLQS
nr:RNA-directed DNA polymerase, eukaryota, nucleotide-binding alpha-beta plait domain protein [Tanacetum cinerariifolium]